MKKRIWKLWLILVFCPGLMLSLTLPAAAADPSITVGGLTLTGSAASPAYATTTDGSVTQCGSEDNYNIKWNGTTLTLKGAVINATETNGISCDTDFTLALEETNTVTGANYGISATGTLTVSGDGTLNANGETYGIFATNLTVSGGTVNGTATDKNFGYGVYATSTLTVSSGGSLTGTGAEYGIYTTDTLTVSGSVRGEATGDAGFGVHAGTIDVTGGSLTGEVTKDEEKGNYGIEATTLTVEGGRVDATGPAHGINVDGITVSGGTVTGKAVGADSVGSGICAKTINVTGGDLTGEATGAKNDGIYVTTALAVSNTGTVTGKAVGESCKGIEVVNGNLTVSGGTVTGKTTGAEGYGISVAVTEDTAAAVTVTVTGGTVQGIGGGNGIDISGSLTVSGGQVTGKASGSSGLTVEGSLTVSGTGSVKGEATGTEGYGIYARDIIVQGGSVEAATKGSRAIYLSNTTGGIAIRPAGGATIRVLARPAFGTEIRETYTKDETFSGLSFYQYILVTTGELPSAQTTIAVGGVTLTGSAASPAYATTTDGTVSEVVSGDDCNITWDGETLTLQNAVIDTTENYGIQSTAGFTLRLEDENSVTAGKDAIHVTGNLTVSGDGSLTATGESDNGIYIEDGTLTVTSGTVTAKSTNKYGIWVYEISNVPDGIIVSGGTVIGEATGEDSSGIYVSNGSLTVSGGTVIGKATGEDSSGIYVSNGSLTVSGGSVTGTGAYCGVRAVTLTVSGAVRGEATGDAGYGVHAGTIDVTGGSLTGISQGRFPGISASSSLTVADGTVTGTSKAMCGIQIDGTVTVTGGTVTAQGTAAILVVHTGEAEAEALIALPKGYLPEGYELQAIFQEARNRTVASIVPTGGTLVEENGTFCGVAEAITLKDRTGTTPGGSTGGGSTGGGSTGGGSTGGGSSGTTNKTETVTNPDGSTTTTVTNTATGTVTETTKIPDGSKEVVETKKDGATTTTVTKPGGASSVTKTDADGRTEAEVKLPAAAVEEAQEKGEPAALPMPELPVTADQQNAPTVTVDLPSGTSAKVEIPVKDVTAGTVAILVKDDGTEEILKTSIPTENGLAVTLSDGDTVKIVDNSKAFTDVPAGAWYRDAVDFVSARELFSGTSETTFSPNAPMTRGMFVTVLARLEGVDTSVGDTWYEAGQQWAMENGISDGTHMDQALTREQLATMLHRYAGSPAAGGSLSGYTDAASVSSWASDAMAWAVEQGIIGGTTATDLSPQGPATRAQVATMLMRFLESLEA